MFSPIRVELRQGEEFTRANVKDFGHAICRRSGWVDCRNKEVPIDPARLALWGWTTAVLTMWTVKQTNRFRAQPSPARALPIGQVTTDEINRSMG